MTTNLVVQADDPTPSGREDTWRNAVGSTLLPMDMRSESGHGLGSRIASCQLGPMRVTEVHGHAGVAFRTHDNIRRCDPEVYQVVVQTRGETLAEQDGRTARLRPGDFGVSDSSRPFRCAHTAFEIVCVTFPRQLIPLRQDDVARVTGRRFAGDQGSVAMVSSLVGRLPAVLTERPGPERARLGTAVLDLVTVALTGRLDRERAVAPDTSRRVLLMRIQAYLGAHLAEPDLSPATIAAAHHISARYLHRLFEPTGTSVASWIRARRLSHIRRDLLDPALADHPVYAIGARWGFADAAHLNRTFRSAYGVPPGEYRARAGLSTAS